MNLYKVAFRGFFLLVLVISLAVRYYQITVLDHQIKSHNVHQRVADIVSKAGMKITENTAPSSTLVSRVLYIQQPDCPYPSLVLPFYLISDVFTILNEVENTHYTYRFFYLNESWPNVQNRFRTLVLWAKYNFLYGLGRSPFIPTKRAVVIADPVACANTIQIDWREAWQETKS